MKNKYAHNFEIHLKTLPKAHRNWFPFIPSEGRTDFLKLCINL